MNQGADPSSDATPTVSPYDRLGIAADAGFEAVQEAKQLRLSEVGDDPQARARIEAAYDAVLMERLKERQQGRVSSAAFTASQREAIRPVAATPARPTLPPLPKIASLPRPTVALAEGRDRWLPLAVTAGLLGLLLLAPAGTAELVLALGTLLTTVALQRRGSRLLAAAGWSVLLLCLGLLLGGLLLTLIDPTLPLGLPLAPQQVQALPALLLLLLGALLIG